MVSNYISLEDVADAMEGLDPETTGAKSIRKIIGRGSFATIQNHINTIRNNGIPVSRVKENNIVDYQSVVGEQPHGDMQELLSRMKSIAMVADIDIRMDSLKSENKSLRDSLREALIEKGRLEAELTLLSIGMDL